MRKIGGSILLVVMIFLALMVGISTIMLMRHHQILKQTETILAVDNAKLQAEDDWRLLKIEMEKNTFNPNKFASPKISIVNASALYNLNNLQFPRYEASLVMLIQQIDDKYPAPHQLAWNIRQWLLPKVASDSRYDDGYRQQQLPYLPAHREMVEVSELKLVLGMNQALYEKLKPYLCTLPGETKLDVNAASLPVLAAAGLPAPAAQAVVSRRQQKRYDTLMEFMADPIVANHLKPDLVNATMTTEGEYFIVTITEAYNGYSVPLTILCQRKQLGQKTLVKVLWQKQQP